jgi:hypothetical protein
MQDVGCWFALILFICVVPIGIFVGRSNIRISRREIVRDSERLFQFAHSDGRSLILPSFELVRYKYDPEANPERPAGDGNPNSFVYYVIPVLMYIALTTICSYMAFRHGASEDLSSSAFADPAGRLGGELTYAFLGGYDWTVVYLVRRIGNCDLSPISFFQLGGCEFCRYLNSLSYMR